MSIVKIKDKTFKTSISEAEIKARIKEVAQRINRDMEGKNPLLLGVLNGSFIRRAAAGTTDSIATAKATAEATATVR